MVERGGDFFGVVKPAVSVEGVEPRLRENEDHVPPDEVGEVLEVYGKFCLDSDLLVGSLLFIASLEVKEAPAGHLLVAGVHELHRDRLPRHGAAGETVELRLVHEQFDVDVVEAGEDNVARGDGAVLRHEEVAVLELLLEVAEARHGAVGA